MNTRYDQLAEAARRFYIAHPEVWDFFVKFTFDRIQKGYSNYGAKGIFERIRWETPLGDDGKVAFKIGNNHASFYARGFMKRYPEHEGFFRLREQTSKKDAPMRKPELTPADYEYEN